MLNAVPDSRDPSAILQKLIGTSPAPGCLVIDHGVPVGLGKKRDILGEAKALLFAQPGRGKTDARCFKSYKYVCCDLSHKDASTHNFFNHSQFPLKS